jgi:hypothetical protein
MWSYYKGECTLDALSVEYFCANDVVFNWCSYLLEELLVACEEAQEKGDTFTYGYLLVVFAMLKWMPPVGRPLSPSRQGSIGKDVRALALKVRLGEHCLQQHNVLEMVQHVA